jgi:RHS repeat-associated protein
VERGDRSRLDPPDAGGHDGRQRLPDWPSPRDLAAGILAALALALLAHLLWLRRIGLPVPRAALSGATAWLFLAALSAPVAAAPRDGDVNEDGVLDAADLLRLHLVAIGMETATQADQDHGDLAPMVGPPDGINPADPLLLARALRGEDVDGDGLSTAEELAAEASPFRSDTDSDGFSDAEELAQGTHPACADHANPALADADCDGESDADELAEGTNPHKRDTDGDGIDDGDDTSPRQGERYRHGDHLGSSVLVTGDAGTVVARIAYAPYGEALGGLAVARGEGVSFGFTGQRLEAGTGLYDYGARWYDPELGRFLQPDTIVPDPFSPQMLNRYAYVVNDPVNLIDPTGSFPSLGGIIGGIGGAIGSAISAVGGWFGSAWDFLGGVWGSAWDFAVASLSGWLPPALLGFDTTNAAQIVSPDAASGTEASDGGSIISTSSESQGLAGGSFWSRADDATGKAWNLPNTALGLAYGAVGGLIAAAVHVASLGLVDLGFGVSIGNNAIQFTNHPLQRLLGGGAITLGNVIAFGGLPDDAAPTWVPFVSIPIGRHEREHTFQGQVLGPLYFPAHLIGGVAGILGTPFTGLGPGGSPWHGALNFMERGPSSVPPRAWP